MYAFATSADARQKLQRLLKAKKPRMDRMNSLRLSSSESEIEEVDEVFESSLRRSHDSKEDNKEQEEEKVPLIDFKRLEEEHYTPNPVGIIRDVRKESVELQPNLEKNISSKNGEVEPSPQTSNELEIEDLPEDIFLDMDELEIPDEEVIDDFVEEIITRKFNFQ